MRRFLIATTLIASMVLGLPRMNRAQATPLQEDSGQCHWLQTNGVLGHTHIDLDTTNTPSINDVLRVNFTVTLFHAIAQIHEIYAGNYKSSDAFDWFWDDTQSSTPPALVGDPAGVKVWTGHFSVRPQIPHGYAWVSMSLYTHFSDRTTTVMLNEPYYSIVDPSKPSPNDLDPSARRTQAVCRVSPPVLPNGENDNAAPFYGEQTAQFDTALPRTPISALVPMTGSTYGYGARDMAVATADFVLDMNLHAGIPGTTLFAGAEPGPEMGLAHVPMPWDPAVIGPGDHKLTVRRTQTNGPELSAVLLVTHVTVSGDVPPPPPPPPPPTPVSQPVFGQEFNGVFSVCVKDVTHCLVVN